MSSTKEPEHENREEEEAPANEDEDTGAQVAPIVKLEVVRSPQKLQPIPRQLNNKHISNGQGNSKGRKINTDSSGNAEEDANTSKNGPGKGKGIGNPTHPMRSFTNSNVQAINNSILFNSSCTHQEPGVHLSFSRKLSHSKGGGAV